jgi:hypothetical protein
MSKKRGERALVEALLDSGLVGAATLLEWERERPDALISTEQRIVGIEVTKLAEAVPRHPVAPQKWNVEAERIVEAARLVFEGSDPRRLIVSLAFTPEWVPPNRLAASGLASELAALVADVHAKKSPTPARAATVVNPHPAVSWAYVGVSQAGTSRWAPSFGWRGKRAGEEDIRATVGRKEPELAEYRRAAGDVWLLIDCDVTGQAVAFDIPDPDFSVVTGFNRLFCCGFGRWQWVEVPCVPIDAASPTG